MRRPPTTTTTHNHIRLEALEGTDALQDGTGEIVGTKDDQHGPQELEDTGKHQLLAIGLEQHLSLIMRGFVREVGLERYNHRTSVVDRHDVRVIP